MSYKRAYNGASSSTARTRDDALAFANKRSESWWRLREELSPDNEGGSQVALPPGAEILAGRSDGADAVIGGGCISTVFRNVESVRPSWLNSSKLTPPRRAYHANI